MDFNYLQSQFDEVKDLIKEKGFECKDVLDLNEASKYTGLAKSFLYKLTAKGEIPHYCPNGKKLFFVRKQLREWLLRNPRGGQQ